MPRGRPKKEQTNGKQISKMEAMRRALAELGQDAKPVDYQTFMKSRFGIEMGMKMITNYKSSLLRKKAAKRSAVVRAPKAEATGFSLDDIQAVKALADKIGAQKVKQLAQVLEK